MNIYEKLQAMRVELQRQDIKKSGKNTFAKYEYFELADFLPRINELMHEYKVCSAITFLSDVAILTLINAEEPQDRIEFASPMSKAELKGCHEVQNLGAVQTYLRRYLYAAAFEIVEHDALDSTTGDDKPKAQPKAQQKSAPPAAPPEQPAAQPPTRPTSEMIQFLYRVAQKSGYETAAVAGHILKKYACVPKEMTIAQYNEMMEGYKALAAQRS